MPALLGKGLGSKVQEFDILYDALDRRTKFSFPVSIQKFSRKKRYIGLGLFGLLFVRKSWNALVSKTTMEKGAIKRFGD